MLNRILVSGICVAVSVCGVAIWRMQHAGAAASFAVAPLPVPVVAEKVRVSDMPIVLTGIGTVAAYNVVDVHAQVAGTIDKIGFIEGQSVHPGSLIAQLDPRPFQASLRQTEAALAHDTANLAAAQANLTRYSTLLRQGDATSQQVSDQTATVNELQAAIVSDRAAIFNARLSSAIPRSPPRSMASPVSLASISATSCSRPRRHRSSQSPRSNQFRSCSRCRRGIFPTCGRRWLRGR